MNRDEDNFECGRRVKGFSQVAFQDQITIYIQCSLKGPDLAISIQTDYWWQNNSD